MSKRDLCIRELAVTEQNFIDALVMIQQVTTVFFSSLLSSLSFFLLIFLLFQSLFPSSFSSFQPFLSLFSLPLFSCFFLHVPFSLCFAFFSSLYFHHCNLPQYFMQPLKELLQPQDFDTIFSYIDVSHHFFLVAVWTLCLYGPCACMTHMVV